MVEEENGLIVNDEGELLIHEDSIIETTEMSAEELAVLQASKDAAKFVQDLQRDNSKQSCHCRTNLALTCWGYF